MIRYSIQARRAEEDIESYNLYLTEAIDRMRVLLTEGWVIYAWQENDETPDEAA